MAHGAPDHVRMSDVNLLDYTDIVYYNANHLIVNGTTWTPININNVGCFGFLHLWMNHHLVTVRIDVDGVRIFDQHPADIYTYLAGQGQSLGQVCGVGRYDVVTPVCSMWVNYNYMISFKQSFVVSINNVTGANRTMHDLNIYWKEKE